MMTTYRRVTAVVACTMTAACTAGLRDIPVAPDQVSLEGVQVKLAPYLWRDYQPISPPDGRPLAAVLRVHTVDGSPIPVDWQADSVWVVNADAIWAARVVEEQRREAGGTFFDVVAWGGPKWDPGTSVDVVLGLRDATGRRLLLEAHRQLIHRTD